MTNQSTDATFEPYLPAGFRPSAVPGPVERLLTKPFRRQLEIWTTDE